MIELVLYRAARKDGPYFGHGSYWSPSRPFVEHFRRDSYEQFLGGEVGIYRLAVQVADDEVADLRVVFGTYPFDPKLLSDAALDAFAARGFRWLAFHDTGLNGHYYPSYVYLGAEPIDAEEDDLTDIERETGQSMPPTQRESGN